MKLEDNKYEFKLDDDGQLICLRHKEQWRDFVGDKAVRALYDYAVQLEEKIDVQRD